MGMLPAFFEVRVVKLAFLAASLFASLSPAWAAQFAFFRGTFDPVHNGHLNLVSSAISTFSLTRVFVSVNYSPPHKPNASEFRHRRNMTVLGFAGVKEVSVLGPAMSKRVHGDAYETFIETFARTHPLDMIYLLYGDDNYEYFYEPDSERRIPRGANIRVAVCPRNPSRSVDVREPSTTCVYYSPFHTSSTENRDLIAKGADFSQNLRPAVSAYARKERLYCAGALGAEH
jgi:nicotinate-nucleotide adenylyltransferase